MNSRIKLIIFSALFSFVSNAEYNPYARNTNPFTAPNWQREQAQQPQQPMPVQQPQDIRGTACNFATDCGPGYRCLKRRYETVGVCY